MLSGWESATPPGQNTNPSQVSTQQKLTRSFTSESTGINRVKHLYTKEHNTVVWPRSSCAAAVHLAIFPLTKNLVLLHSRLRYCAFQSAKVELCFQKAVFRSFHFSTRFDFPEVLVVDTAAVPQRRNVYMVSQHIALSLQILPLRLPPPPPPRTSAVIMSLCKGAFDIQLLVWLGSRSVNSSTWEFKYPLSAPHPTLHSNGLNLLLKMKDVESLRN